VKRTLTVFVSLLLISGSVMAKVSEQQAKKAAAGGWISLFDGKSLDGWKASDDPASFSVAAGNIVVNAKGGPSHLYYVGSAQNHHFKNFELKLDIQTFPGANSGVYIATEYQDTGWPSKGYEVQVNNSHTDPKRTGGLYNIQDNMTPPAKDNEWFTMDIKVEGKHITVKVNDKQLVDYTEPADVKRPEGMKDRVLGDGGTIALQGHDPKSKVLYKNIMIKPLP
jgi:Domain of Unknown Function (DUF1080)